MLGGKHSVANIDCKCRFTTIYPKCRNRKYNKKSCTRLAVGRLQLLLRVVPVAFYLFIAN